MTDTKYVHRTIPEYGCPCGWVLIESGDIRCQNPSTHWSYISGLSYCEEHAYQFVHGRLVLEKLNKE